MRSAVAQANTAVNQAGSTAAQYGGQANQIQSQVVPFEERQLTSPSGYSPQDMASLHAAVQQGAGGASAAMQGAQKLAAARGNVSPSSVLGDQTARQTQQAITQGNLDIAAQNAKLKQTQQATAAKDLGGFMTADQEAALRAQGLGIQGIGAETAANQTGWFQNFSQLAKQGAQGLAAGAALAG